MNRYLVLLLLLILLGGWRGPGDPEDHGFLRVDANGRYFVFDDGTSYVPVGFNRFMLYQQSEKSIDSLLSLWSRYGVNYLRLWVGLASEPEIEVGKFNGDRLERLDYIVSRCQDYGIYLSICFWDENTLRSGWKWGWDSGRLVYNHKLYESGTADSATDLQGITDADSWRAMKTRYRFFVQRWKDYRSLFMWDLVNDCKKTDEWKSAMYDFVRSVDDHDHIITVQYNTGRDPGGDMDCGSVRVYDYNPAGNDAEEMAKSLFARVQQAVVHGDPVYCGEGGMDHKTGQRRDLERGFLHMLWGPLAVGAAGNLHSWVSPPKWTALNMKELRWVRNFSKFCAQVDWKNFNSVDKSDKLSASGKNIRTYACGDGNSMLIYLMNDDPEKKFKAVSPSLTLAQGSIKMPAVIDWINIKSGKVIRKSRLDKENRKIRVPSFRNGIFAWVRAQ